MEVMEWTGTAATTISIKSVFHVFTIFDTFQDYQAHLFGTNIFTANGVVLRKLS